MSDLKNNEPSTTTAAAIVEQAIPTMETPSTTTSKEPVVEAPKVVEKPEELSALASLGLKKDSEIPPVDPTKVDVKKDEVPPVDPAKVETPKVEAYELELSDKSPLSEKDLDEVVALAEKYKWTKDEAEKFIKNKEELHTRGVENIRNQALEIINKQKAEFLKDPNFVGEKLVESLAIMDEVVKKFGDPALRDYLRGPGGNSLPLAKMLLKIGNSMKEDTMQGRGTHRSEQPKATVESAMKTLYPSFFKENEN